jgi:hypothetical protein
VVTHDLVVQGAVLQRDFEHVAASLFHGLLHSSRNLFGLAFAHADAAIAVTNYRQGCETQNTTALDHFGHAVDRNHFLAQTVLRTLGLTLHFCLNFCHCVFRSA